MDKVSALLVGIFLLGLCINRIRADPVYISGNFSTDLEFNKFWEEYNGEPNIIRLDIKKKNEGWNCCIYTSPARDDTIQWQYNCPLSNFTTLLHSFRDLRISCSEAVSIEYMMFATQTKINKTYAQEPEYKNEIKADRGNRLTEIILLFSLVMLANLLAYITIYIGKNIYNYCKNNKNLPKVVENYKKQNSIV